MTLFESMVAKYVRRTEFDERNAIHEVMQVIALAGLSRGGFFEKAAFYGGTCLHLLHGLPRFSEDMDFSLLAPDESFRSEDYFQAVKEEFRMAGKEVEIKLKHKGRPSSIESAFLKESSDVFDIGFTTEQRLKVKIKVDIDPPPKFATELVPMQLPRTFLIRAYDLPGLYAGKVSAVLFRQWKNRVKGRDWYDLAWYVKEQVPINLAHLIERGKEHAPETDLATPQAVLTALDARIESVDFDNAREDVLPYVVDSSELEFWNREFFHRLVRRMSFD